MCLAVSLSETGWSWPQRVLASAGLGLRLFLPQLALACVCFASVGLGLRLFWPQLAMTCVCFGLSWPWPASVLALVGLGLRRLWPQLAMACVCCGLSWSWPASVLVSAGLGLRLLWSQLALSCVCFGLSAGESESSKEKAMSGIDAMTRSTEQQRMNEKEGDNSNASGFLHAPINIITVTTCSDDHSVVLASAGLNSGLHLLWPAHRFGLRLVWPQSVPVAYPANDG